MLIGAPFQVIAPWAVTPTVFFSGWMGGGGVLVACGRSSFTACVWIGRVMMNMIRSTSMTSMSGVTFISIIGSPEALSLVVCIDMALNSYRAALMAPLGGGSEMKPTRWKPACCMVMMAAPMHLYWVLMSPRMCASGILSSLMFWTPPTFLI